MKRTCETPGCNGVGNKPYKGYRKETYHFCYDCYQSVWKAFEWIVFTLAYWTDRNRDCGNWGRHAPLVVHHNPLRSQGGRNILEHCQSWCIYCHDRRHR